MLCGCGELSYQDKVDNFSVENLELKKGQIVFVGDSITEKYNLKEHYKDINLQVYNRGISGDTVDWLLNRIQVSAIDLLPSIIVLMIGSNDINYGRSAEEIANGYNNLLNFISTNLPNSKLYLLSIIPQNNKYSINAYQNNQTIIKTNQKIQNLATFYGYKYVNLYDELLDEKGFLDVNYSKDGLHLNKKGYKIWTALMKNVLV